MYEVIAFIRKIGALGAIRTPGPQIRSLMLYPAELRARGKVSLVWRRDKCNPVALKTLAG